MTAIHGKRLRWRSDLGRLVDIHERWLYSASSLLYLACRRLFLFHPFTVCFRFFQDFSTSFSFSWTLAQRGLLAKSEISIKIAFLFDEGALCLATLQSIGASHWNRYSLSTGD